MADKKEYTYTIEQKEMRHVVNHYRNGELINSINFNDSSYKNVYDITEGHINAMNKYTMTELIASTIARAKMNYDYAFGAETMEEQKRFISNAHHLLDSIPLAIEEDDKEYLIDNRDN